MYSFYRIYSFICIVFAGRVKQNVKPDIIGIISVHSPLPQKP